MKGVQTIAGSLGRWHDLLVFGIRRLSSYKLSFSVLKDRIHALSLNEMLCQFEPGIAFELTRSSEFLRNFHRFNM